MCVCIIILKLHSVARWGQPLQKYRVYTILCMIEWSYEGRKSRNLIFPAHAHCSYK